MKKIKEIVAGGGQREREIHPDSGIAPLIVALAQSLTKLDNRFEVHFEKQLDNIYQLLIDDEPDVDSADRAQFDFAMDTLLYTKKCLNLIKKQDRKKYTGLKNLKIEGP